MDTRDLQGVSKTNLNVAADAGGGFPWLWATLGGAVWVAVAALAVVVLRPRRLR